MTQIVPFLPSSSANFQFQATLDGAQYNCICTFNAYAQRYYFTVYDLTGAMVVSRPIIASPSFYNVNLLAGYFETTMIYRESSQSFEIPGLPAIPLVRPPAPAVATPYPLDPLSVRPAVAFSTRRLLASYTGPCLRVRRLSDSAQQDIMFAGRSIDTGALLAFVGASTGVVSVWYDQSGNAFDAAQPQLNAQPVIVEGGYVKTTNDFPALFINQNNLNFSNSSAAQLDFTIATVFSTAQSNPVTNPNAGFNMSGFVFADYPGNAHDLGFGNLNNRMCIWGGGDTGEHGIGGHTIINEGSTHSSIVTRVSLTGAATIYLDGNTEVSGVGSTGARVDAPELQIGSAGFPPGTTGGSSYPGIFFTPENVIYSSKLSATDLSLLQQAQAVYVSA